MQNFLLSTQEPIVIVTDTTEMYNSYPLADTRWELLAKEISAGEVRWVVPEVVVRETVRHQLEAWECAQNQSLPAIQKAGRSLRQFGIAISVEPETITKAAERATNYEEFLRARITELGGEIAALPAIDHDKLLTWDISGRKPFAATGKGYRDALIWATVLECVVASQSSNCIIFVSNNTRDFISKNGLHVDLLKDLEALQSATTLRHSPGLTDAFKVVKELRGARPESGAPKESSGHGSNSGALRVSDDTVVDPTDLLEPELEDQPSKLRNLLCTALQEQCSTLIGVELEEHSQDGDIYGPGWLSPDIENPSIYELEPDPDSMTWDVAETFSDGTQLINVVAAAALTVDGYMYKSAYYREEPEVDFYTLAADHNDHYAWVAVEGHARITFSILLSPDYDAVNHTELISLETQEASFG